MKLGENEFGYSKQIKQSLMNICYINQPGYNRLGNYEQIWPVLRCLS